MGAPNFRSTPSVQLDSKFTMPRGFFKPGVLVTLTQTTDNKSLKSTVERSSDNRYDPYLTSIKIKQEGELGMLLRVEVNFTIERDGDFNEYSKYFLTPNKKVNLTVNRSARWPAYADNQPLKFTDLVIYDFAWTFNAIEQSYTCTTKMMGSNTLIEDVECMVSFAGAADNAKIKKTIVDTKGKKQEREVSVETLSDYILLQAQKSANVLQVETKWRSAGWFKPTPVEYYVTLQYIIDRINDVIIPYHHNSSLVEKIKQPTYKLQQTISIDELTSEYFISPDPMSVVYTGTFDNGKYGVIDGTKFELTGIPAVTVANGIISLPNIYISRTALIAIETEAQRAGDTTAKSDKLNESNRSSVAMTISQFIQKLSALINQNSGGFIDLVTYADDDPSTGITHIVNRNTRDGSTAKPLELNNRYPGDGVTISVDITAEVPKDQVSANAYANNLKGLTAQEIDEKNSQVAAARTKSQKTWTKALARMFVYRTIELPDNEYDTETVQAAQRTLRTVIQNIPIKEAKKYLNSPYPLKLKLQLQGVAGFKFGDLITLKHLPSQYKNTVCFRVVRVSHTIENNDWTTDLETVCDLL